MSRIHDAIAKANARREQQAQAPTAPPSPPQEFPEPQQEVLPAGLEEKLPRVEPLPLRDPMLMTDEPYFRRAREQFRKLKSEILTRLKVGTTGSASLLVTSAFSGDGKTTLALNLGLVLAKEYDHTVLLVDADLRQPRLHSFLDIPQSPGLLQCLQGEGIPSEAFIPTGHGNLVVMPAGGRAENSAEILASTRMQAFVRELKARYPDRIILFDTPPCSLFADANVLSASVDGILFVARQGHGSPQKILECYKSLPREKHLGVIYNDAQLGDAAGNYYGYYG